MTERLTEQELHELLRQQAEQIRQQAEQIERLQKRIEQLERQQRKYAAPDYPSKRGIGVIHAHVTLGSTPSHLRVIQCPKPQQGSECRKLANQVPDYGAGVSDPNNTVTSAPGAPSWPDT